ncbi:MAG: hypothetical protein JW731_07650 [Bacteroidales bacterium]|nr:hypothetical protein [Bacteroidales bacterium]
MKLLVTLMGVAFITLATQSQSIYSLNYTMGFGVGETSDFIGSPSFRGVTFEGRGFLDDQFSLGGYFSWSTFYEKLAGEKFTDGTATLTGTQYRYINAFPMLFQAHYYFGTDEYEPRAYLGAGAGAYKMIQRVDLGVWSIEENHWHFGLSPEVGIFYPVGMDSQLNVNLKYHYVFGVENSLNYSWFGLSVGFAWGD